MSNASMTPIGAGYEGRQMRVMPADITDRRFSRTWAKSHIAATQIFIVLAYAGTSENPTRTVSAPEVRGSKEMGGLGLGVDGACRVR